MALSCCIELSASEQSLLLEIARDSIHAGLRGEGSAATDGHALSPALHAERAVFVTLTRHASLRGCIGTIHPSGPLAAAVAESAYCAAFRDPRFPKLDVKEVGETRIEISVLSPLERVPVNSREELLAKLHPGADGLLLEDGRYRSTFLPKVWEQLPEPEDFLAHLMAKAGLAVDHWSPSLRVHRYRTLTFGDAPARVLAT
jgi:AmmeMemoRadiSam system protein A